MGTPEDVAAEKHFTPPTLTEMLKVILPDPDEPELKPIKEAFKEWLRTVGLGGYDTPESIRQLLIVLVDEP